MQKTYLPYNQAADSVQLIPMADLVRGNLG